MQQGFTAQICYFHSQATNTYQLFKFGSLGKSFARLALKWLKRNLLFYVNQS